MDILAIKATETKFKKEKKTVYAFSIGNNNFEACFSNGKKPALVLSHNGTQIGVVEKAGNKVPFTVNTENAPINITAWIEGGFSSWLFGKTQGGIGVEADGKPVQHTLADPGTHIKAGKTGLFLLLLLLALKGIFSIVSQSIAAAALFFVLMLIVLAAILMYKKWLTFALYAGLVLSALETVDYVSGIPAVIQSGIRPVSMGVWVLYRVSIFANLFNALIWMYRGKTKRKDPFSAV